MDESVIRATIYGIFGGIALSNNSGVLGFVLGLGTGIIACKYNDVYDYYEYIKNKFIDDKSSGKKKR